MNRTRAQLDQTSAQLDQILAQKEKALVQRDKANERAAAEDRRKNERFRLLLEKAGIDPEREVE